MNKNLRWKALLIAAVTLIAVWSFVPPAKAGAPLFSKIKLGLDLQGGVHLVYRVITDAALKVETDTSSEQVVAAAKTANIVVGGAKVLNLTDFQVDGVPAGSEQQFRTVADTTVGGIFNRENGDTPGSYIFKMKPNLVVS